MIRTKLKDLKFLMYVLRLETQPLESHSEPEAVDVNWDSAEEIVNKLLGINDEE